MLTLIVASSYAKAKSWCIQNNKQITDRRSVHIALHPYSVRAFDTEQPFELVVIHEELHPQMVTELRKKGLLHDPATTTE